MRRSSAEPLLTPAEAKRADWLVKVLGMLIHVVGGSSPLAVVLSQAQTELMSLRGTPPNETRRVA